MKNLHIEKKMITLLVVIVVIVGGLAFYAGDVYAAHKATNANTARVGAFAGGAGVRGTRGAGATGGGFSGGTVISKDATSITVQARDGSSKIVFYTANTPIMKTSAGAIGDVAVGSDIAVTGTANSDGSISAQSIQVRPAGASGATQGSAGTATN
jgi:hypothetical protein